MLFRNVCVYPLPRLHIMTTQKAITCTIDFHKDPKTYNSDIMLRFGSKCWNPNITRSMLKVFRQNLQLLTKEKSASYVLLGNF
jgi:hypothetical protein